MASDTLKDVLANGLPGALDRFLGPSTGFEENRQIQPFPVPGAGQGVQNPAPVDNVPGEFIQGVPNAVTVGGAVAAMLAGVGLIVVAVR